MKKFEEILKENKELEVRTYFSSVIKDYKNDPEFIGRYVYTILSNSLLQANKEAQSKLNVDKIKYSIIEYLNKHW